MAIAPCADCPAAYAAAAAVVRHEGGGVWKRMPDSSPAHLAALFRDPGIQTERRIDVVLDLDPDSGRCVRRPWHAHFLQALSTLPSGLVVALDNGVRCPCPQKGDQDRGLYRDRARLCLARTREWLGATQHPDGGRPGIVICDRDLAEVFCALGILLDRNGERWAPPRRWVDSVGNEMRFDGETALVLAHPVVLQREPVYRAAVEAVVPRLIELARITTNRTPQRTH